jgi:hypothetical protein
MSLRQVKRSGEGGKYWKSRKVRLELSFSLFASTSRVSYLLSSQGTNRAKTKGILVESSNQLST